MVKLIKSPIFATSLLLIALVVVGNGDYSEAVTQQEVYCDNVKAGIWPNYKNLECKR